MLSNFYFYLYFSFSVSPSFFFLLLFVVLMASSGDLLQLNLRTLPSEVCKEHQHQPFFSVCRFRT